MFFVAVLCENVTMSDETHPEPNCAEIDQADGADAEVDPEGATEDGDFIAAPEDSQGLDWFDKRNASLGDGIDLAGQNFYHTAPRAWDTEASKIPPNHPLRAIAKVLESSAEDSTVRVKCCRLTDQMAMDMLLHCGAVRTVHVIIDYVPQECVAVESPQKNTVSSLMKFLEFNKHIGSYAIFRLIEIRVAHTKHEEDGHCCKLGLSSMHEKQTITDAHSAHGSYNLTGCARCKNYESIRISPSCGEEMQAFDSHWDALGKNREISEVHPGIIPESQRKKLRIEK